MFATKIPSAVSVIQKGPVMIFQFTKAVTCFQGS
jgi:hypothetical protein